MIKIITTVGTSIITNFMSDDLISVLEEHKLNGKYSIKDEYKMLMRGNHKKAETSIEEKITNCFLSKIQKVDKKQDNDVENSNSVREWVYEENQEMLNVHCSAEVYSIHKIIKRILNKDENEKFEVVLIVTDTALSRLSAKLICKALEKSKLKIKNVTILNIDGLQVNNLQKFNQEGFHHLIKQISALKKDDLKLEYKPKYIFNITGGYKGVIPLLTMYGLITKDEINYIYETSDSLISIRNYPVTFDWTITEFVGPYLDKATFSEVKNNPEVIKMLKQYGFVDKSNNISSFGELFKTMMDESLPEGKTSLGMLAEYKLYEYYLQFDEDIKANYRVSRSIAIKDISENENKPKGNEVDILLEEDGNSPIFIGIWQSNSKIGIKPIKGKYITNELKGFSQVMYGRNIKQFQEHLKLIKENWELPKEIRYVTWELIRSGFPSIAEEKIRKTLIEMNELVKREFNSDTMFKPYLLTLRIDTQKDNSYVNMMQNPILKEDFKLIQL